MLSRITSQTGIFEDIHTYFVQVMSEKQMQAVKKIAAIACLVLGMVLGIYVLYKVASSFFRKKAPQSEASVQQNPQTIDLQKVKDCSSTSLPSPQKQSFEEETLSKPILDTPLQTQMTPKQFPEAEPELQNVIEQFPQLETSIISPTSSMNDDQAQVIPTLETPAPLVDPLPREIEPEEAEASEVVKEDTVLGAHPNAQDINDDPPLHLTSDNLEVIQTFVQNGAKLDVLDRHHRTFLEAQIEECINDPCNTNRKAIFEFLKEKNAPLGQGDYKGELLKKALEGAHDSSHANFHSHTHYDAKKSCLAIAKELIALGADLKTSDPTGTLLMLSLKKGIECKEAHKEDKALYFEIADEVAPLSPKLGECDPQGQLLKMAFNKLIKNESDIWNPGQRAYYFKLADKLIAMGSVRIDVADPKGNLLRDIFKLAMKQDPNNMPKLLKLYYDIADKLIELGATLRSSDPDGQLFQEVIELASNNVSKKRNFYLAIAKELLLRYGDLDQERLLTMNQLLSNLEITDNKNIAQN